MTPNVLVAHGDAAVCRLVRESLEGFCHCQVDATCSALTAYERALHRSYALYLFDLHLEVLSGPLLYDLISRAYSLCHSGALTAPAVIFLCTAQDLIRQEEWLRDVRVKGLLQTPLRIRRLLDKVSGTLEMRPEMEVDGPIAPLS